MYHVSEISGATAGGSGQLALGIPLRRAPPPRPAFGQKGEARRGAAMSAASTSSPISASDIGSGVWFRGLVTCAALCYATWSLAPTWQPLPGASPAPYDDAQLEAAQALAIQPLAYGGDTGRRMAPTDAVEALAESPERPIIDLRATLGRGDGIASLLERAGVGNARGRARSPPCSPAWSPKSGPAPASTSPWAGGRTAASPARSTG